VTLVADAPDRPRLDRRLMGRTAALMYASAALLVLVEAQLPGGPEFSSGPGVGALAVALLIWWLHPRLPRLVLAALGPLGVVLIAWALATTNGAGDGAVLYIWPVLWSAFFFGTAGKWGILGTVAVAHAVVLVALPNDSGYPARWVDVMASLTVLVLVVNMLDHRLDQLLERLAGESRIDPLSAVFNRRGLEESFVIALAHARRDSSTIAAAAFDIDNFKAINDRWGHEAGDEVIRHLAGTLHSQARDVDLVARTGGDEFVVLLSGASSRDAVAFSERVREALATHAPAAPRAYTVSAGTAAAGPEEIDLATLLARADAALYEAKHSGRDRTIDAAWGGRFARGPRPCGR
jgi:diguanylate cyclase (GGDEF)-like protein